MANVGITFKRWTGSVWDVLYPAADYATLINKPSTFAPASHSNTAHTETYVTQSHTHGYYNSDGQLASQASPSVTSGYFTNVSGVLYWGDGSARTVLHSNNYSTYAQPKYLYSAQGSDFTSSSTTIADTAMTLTLLAGKRYLVRFYGMSYAAATTTGIKLGIRMTDTSGAGAPTTIGQFWSQSTTAVSASTVFVGYIYAAATAYSTAGTNATFTTSVSATPGTPCSMEAIIDTGSANRTIYIGAGSEVSASQITLRSGAVLFAQQLN